MNNLFKSATFKLTGWYLLIIMLICISFSIAIYQVSSNEFERRLPPGPMSSRGPTIDPTILDDIRSQRAEESRMVLASNLLLINIAALALGGLASYLLARRTLQPIQEASEAQGRFISDASHELRTPLAIMRSEIEVALRGKNLSNEKLRQLIVSNLEEVDKLHNLSERLLQLSNGHNLELTTVSLEDVVVDAASPYFKLAKEKKIELVNKVKPIEAIANPESLKDVVSILIDNAIKYSPQKTMITLNTYQKGRNAYIKVQDQGHGIKATDMPHIFDRFYRADLSRSKNIVEGYGLGLAIAKQTMESMGGTITASSILGKETIFTIKLNLPKSSAKSQHS